MWSDFLRRGVLAKAFAVGVSLSLAACGGGGGGSSSDTPRTGTLAVTVTDATTTTGVGGARVLVIDGDTGEVTEVLTTGSNGKASTQVRNGQILLKVSAQGYQPSPASVNDTPLPYAILGGKTTSAAIQLNALADSSTLGRISGKVLDINGSTGVANALVVVNNGVAASWQATSSDSNGNYVMFNVPEGAVSVSALRGGYNFTPVAATVTAGQETSNQNLLSVQAVGAVGGQVQFLSISNTEVDVTLLHPETGEVIPGLRNFTSGQRYSYNDLPDGTFNAIASLETDGLVLDPDHVAKFGIPQITVSGGVATPNPLDFAVTGAVSLVAPANFQELPINLLKFKWDAYPSTKNYVLELTDENGSVIWGGSAPVVGSNYTVGTSTQVTLDPSWTSVPLVEGKLYRVRVFAAVDKNTAPFYTLISASEDLEGVFRVGPAQ